MIAIPLLGGLHHVISGPLDVLHQILAPYNHSVPALERAFQLAKSGKCSSLADLKKHLRAEGYSIAQITARTLVTQLVVLIKMARRHTLKT